MDRVFAVRLRWGLRHPLTWIWLVLFPGLGVWWYNMPARLELPVWQQGVFWTSLVLGFVWSEIEVRPLDGWLRKWSGPVLLLLAAGAFCQLETSIGDPLEMMSTPGYIWSTAIALCVYLIVYALAGRVWIAAIAGSVLFFVWGLGSYFTLLFRGLPLMPNDLLSAGTAADVLGTYELSVTPEVLVIAAVFCGSLAIGLSLRPAQVRRTRLRLAGRLGALAAAVLWLTVGCFCDYADRHFRFYEWNWSENCYFQGYLQTFVMRAEKLIIKPPVGYSEAEVMELLADMEPDETAADEQPNVILIVNESWFDWNQLVDFETDRVVTPFLDELDNCVRGYAVNPNLSTSGAEYEILTSNSTSLMPATTPFTQMDLSNSNSLAKHMLALGYSTSSFHPCTYNNYNRKSVYPNLGFETSWFWNWDQTDELMVELDPLMVVHGGVSDQTCFEQLIRMYEDGGSEPMFLYNLTFQNHGGYEQATFNGGDWEVDPEHRVQITSGFEESRGQAEEYLSCLTYTDDAFRMLVEYFSAQDDPTVICMVGDHMPHFTEEPESAYTGLKYQLRSRGTPFVIWANYPLEEQEVGYIGMPQLAPLLLETAGLPLSPYYQALTELSEEIPVISRDFFQLASGEMDAYTFLEQEEQNPLLRRYLYFENFLIHSKNDASLALCTPFGVPSTD